MAELQLIDLQRRFPETVLVRRLPGAHCPFPQQSPGAGWDGTWAFETK